MKEWVPDSNGAYIGSCLVVIVAGILVSYLKGLRVRLEVKWAAERAVTCAGGCGAGVVSSGSGGGDTSLDYVEKGMAAKTTGGEGGAAGCPGCHPAATSSSVPQTGSGSEASSETNDVATTTNTCRHTAAATAAPAVLYHKATTNISSWLNSGQAKRNLFRSMFTGIVVFLDYMLMLIVMTFNIGLIVSAVLGFMLGAVLFGHYGERQPGSGGVAAVVAGSMAPQDESDMEVLFVEQACCNTHHIGG